MTSVTVVESGGSAGDLGSAGSVSSLIPVDLSRWWVFTVGIYVSDALMTCLAGMSHWLCFITDRGEGFPQKVTVSFLCKTDRLPYCRSAALLNIPFPLTSEVC